MAFRQGEVGSQLVTDVRQLGPVQMGAPAEAVRIAAGKRRTLLGALALRIGRTVGTDELAEVLWGDQPPGSVGKLLQV